MKIAVFGATGRIGSRIVTEALNRGFDVTAAVRHPENYTAESPHLKVAKADLFKTQDVEAAAFNQDAVVCAYNFTHGAQPSTFTEVTVPLVNGMKQAGAKRLLIVGGAGSLEVAETLAPERAKDFPGLHERLHPRSADDEYRIGRKKVEPGVCVGRIVGQSIGLN